MATKITQDGFDGELQKESKDCQFPGLSQIIHSWEPSLSGLVCRPDGMPHLKKKMNVLIKGSSFPH